MIRLMTRKNCITRKTQEFLLPSLPFSKVKIAFALALQLMCSIFSAMDLELSITQYCLNEEYKNDL